MLPLSEIFQVLWETLPGSNLPPSETGYRETESVTGLKERPEKLQIS